MYFTRIVQASLDVFWQRIIIHSSLECNQWNALCRKSSIFTFKTALVCTDIGWCFLDMVRCCKGVFFNQKQFIHFSCLLYSVKSFGLVLSFSLRIAWLLIVKLLLRLFSILPKGWFWIFQPIFGFLHLHLLGLHIGSSSEKLPKSISTLKTSSRSFYGLGETACQSIIKLILSLSKHYV